MQLQAYFSGPTRPAGPRDRAPLKPTLAPTADGEGIALDALPAAELVGFWLGSENKRQKKEPAATLSAAAGFLRDLSRHQEPAKWAAQDSNL